MLNRLKHHLRRRLTALIASGAAAALVAERHQQELAAKWSPALKAAQHGLFHHYRAMARAGTVPSMDDVGYRVFSQFDEDGLFVFLFAVIGTYNKTFIDIGAGDGFSNSNCANLAINFGWYGLFIDGNLDNVERGREFYRTHPDTMLYPPRSCRRW